MGYVNPFRTKVLYHFKAPRRYNFNVSETGEYSRDETAGFDPDGDYLTVAQAAELLGINTQSCRNAAVHGNLKSINVFGRVLIPRAALEEYRVRTQPDGKPRTGRPKKTG